AEAFPEDVQLIVVIGGDGSILHAAHLAVKADVPLLGINLGRLGYLASLEPSELTLLSLLAEGKYSEKKRMLLSLSVPGDPGQTVVALNDIVISGGGHLADLKLYDGDSSLSYRADGLIFSTPTGTTAYSLSAGGPVLDENMEALCVTPICPRSFFARSLIFAPETSLTVENVTQRGDGLSVTVDGKTVFPLRKSGKITVTRADRYVRFMDLRPRKLMDVLFHKMNMQNF
ncbi:MAG: NAD(+)/NADH kinase, partial [Clostridia bacterium]|nr:NAD(+)/NADH kinase [Clostridia bacterium]